MIKKIIYTFVVLFMTFSVAACTTGGGNNTPQTDENEVKVIQVNQLIEKLPEEITLENDSTIKQIITLYDSLPVKYREKILNYEKVLEAKMIIEVLKNNQALINSAQKIIDEINSLPKVEDLTLDDFEKVTNIKKSYDALTNEVKELVTNYSVLEQLLSKLEELKQEVQEKINEVINAINSLPTLENLKLTDKTTIQNVREKYENLANSEKKLISNISKLEELEQKILELEQIEINKSEAQVIINLINALPIISDVTLKDKTKIEEARLAYNNLSNDAKEYVNNINKLESLEQKVQQLEKEELYKSEAQVVIGLINALPITSQVTLNDKTKIDEARNAYNNLSNDAKKYITNLAKLENLEKRIDEIIEAKSSATEVINLIIALPNVDDVDLDDKEKVLSVRETYNNLSDEAKTYVNNLNKLEELENRIHILETTITNNILDCVSDVATSNTVDTLILENNDATFKWSSSNKNLYVINGEEATINKAYQTHQTQTVTVTVTITYKSGGTATKSKEIIVNPVLFDSMPSTPVATYYQSGATSTYKNYSNRYKKEKTLFSDKAKEVLDIVYYAFAIPAADGTISISNISYFNEVIKIREAGVRVVLSINGVGTDTFNAFNTITKDATLISKFVKNTMNLVDANYLDGVDIDWESISTNNAVVASQMNDLVKAFRQEMNNRQAKDGTPYLLTAAIPGTSWGAASSRFDLKTLNSYLDYVNMMSYDLNRTDKTSHLSPMYKSSNDGGYGFGVDYGTTLFVNAGLSRSKIIVGSAGYGKAFNVTGTVSSTSKYPGLAVSGSLTQISGVTGSYESGTLFGNAIDTLIASGKYTKYIEYNSSNKIVGSYLYNATDKIFVTYESEEIIAAKYEFASTYTGMGIMCWAYTEDTADRYINTIYDNLN